jgi:Spy/CpxP family protein refolding chaperone
MKKIVMTMVALLTMTAAVAQDNERRERREFKKPTPEEMTNRMAESLKLDDKQKDKVLELNKEYESVLMGGPGMGRGFGRGQRGPRPDGETGASQNNDQQRPRPQLPELTDEQKAQMKQQMEKRQEYDKKLQKILTDEQYKTYQEQHQRRGGRGGFGGPRGQRGPRPDMQ